MRRTSPCRVKQPLRHGRQLPPTRSGVGGNREAKWIAGYTGGSLRCYHILKPTLVRRPNRLLASRHPEWVRDRAAVVREARRSREGRDCKL